MIEKPGWTNHSKECEPYVYLSVILITLLAGLTLSPHLTGLTSTPIQKQARIFLIAIGTSLLLIMCWVIIQRIIKTPASVEKKEKTAFWLSHLILYTLLGYYAPSLFFLGLCCGVMWEFFECFTFKWADTKINIVCKGTPDIIANILGLSFGVLCRILRTRLT